MGLAAGNISLKHKVSRQVETRTLWAGLLNQTAATQRRKESHNATEQRQRQRIDEKKKELELLLPTGDPNKTMPPC
jgi:hypothetical protein